MDDKAILLMCQERQKKILHAVADLCERMDIVYWLDSGTLLGAVRHKGFIPWDDDIDIAMPRKDFINFQRIAPKYLPDEYFLQSAHTDHYYGRFILKVRDNKSTFVETFEKGRNIQYNQGIFIDIFPVDGVKEKRANFIKSYLKMLGRLFSVNELGPHDTKYILKKFLQERNMLFAFGERLYQLLIDSSVGSRSKYFLPYAYFYGVNRDMLDYEDIYPLKKLSFCGEDYNVPANFDRYLRIQYGDYWQLPKLEDRKSHNVIIKFQE